MYRAVSIGKWLLPSSFRRNLLPSCTGSKKVDRSVIMAKLRVIQRYVSTDEGEGGLCLPCGAQSGMYNNHKQVTLINVVGCLHGRFSTS